MHVLSRLSTISEVAQNVTQAWCKSSLIRIVKKATIPQNLVWHFACTANFLQYSPQTFLDETLQTVLANTLAWLGSITLYKENLTAQPMHSSKQKLQLHKPHLTYKKKGFAKSPTALAWSATLGCITVRWGLLYISCKKDSPVPGLMVGNSTSNLCADVNPSHLIKIIATRNCNHTHIIIDRV